MYAIVERLAEMLGLMNMTTKCGKYSNKAHLHRTADTSSELRVQRTVWTESGAHKSPVRPILPML